MGGCQSKTANTTKNNNNNNTNNTNNNRNGQPNGNVPSSNNNVANSGRNFNNSQSKNNSSNGNANNSGYSNNNRNKGGINDNDVNMDFLNSQSLKEADIPDQPIYSSDVLESVRIDWNELSFDMSKKDTILGYGMFGVVIRGTWIPKNTKIEHDVAVKLFIQSTNNVPESEYLKVCSVAYDEIEIMKRAEKYIGSSEYIVKAHGLLMGSLPPTLATILDLRQEGLALSGIGIVMRNEAGGTLTSLIYPKKRNSSSNPANQFPLYEKIRILSQIAKGLAELHSAGVIHADIKPANILLSNDKPSKVRLADFGLSITRQRNMNASLIKSTLALTQQTQG